MRKSTPRKPQRIAMAGGIDAIARTRPIDTNNLINMRLMAYLHFDSIMSGTVETPTPEKSWTQATQWMALIMTGAAIAQHMFNHARDNRRPRTRLSEILEKRSRDAYLALATALVKARERKSECLVMDAGQLEASRKFLHLYDQVLGIVTVGQISDAADATSHGIRVFREEMMR